MVSYLCSESLPLDEEHKIVGNYRSPLRGVREKILEERVAGTSVVLLARKYCVSRQAIYDVLKDMESRGHEVPWHKPRKSKKNCLVCAKEFWPSSSRVKTCSGECLRSHKQALAVEKDRPWSRLKFEELVCAYCGKVFKRSRYQQKIALSRFPDKKNFCSRKCNISGRYLRN